MKRFAAIGLLVTVCVAALVNCDRTGGSNDAAALEADATSQGAGSRNGNASSRDVRSTVSVESREYKIRIVPSAVDEEAEREELVRVVSGLRAPGNAAPEIDAKKCRRIAYLDTTSQDVRASGAILRLRQKLAEHRCSSGELGTPELTWKVRGTAEVIARTLELPWANGRKVEEDVLIGPRGGAPVRRLSVSDDAEVASAPTTIGDAARTFGSPPTTLDPGLVIAAGCRVAFERRWELQVDGLAPGVDDVELAIWFDSEDEARPILAELSFKVEDVDSLETPAADALSGSLVDVLGPRVDEVRSKTAALYDCGDTRAQ